MKKHSLLFIINLFLLLFSNSTLARSHYNLDTNELFIPVLNVNSNIFEVKLSFDGQKFQVTNTQPSTQTSDQPANFDSLTGVATIPYIEIIGSDSVYAATLTLVSTTPVITLELTTLQEITVDLTPSNTTPTAENISVRSNPTSPFLEAQLLGLDADNDTLVYVLDAPIEGGGYQQAFVNPSNGQFFATLRNDGINQIVLPYRVSDGKTFSRTANITITIDEVENGGLGSETIPIDEYGRLALTFFDGGRLGSAPGANPTLPTSIDLSGNFPSPGNQGQLGSCVGWATAYALKSFQERIEEQWSFSHATIFSPSWIYNQINGGRDQGSRIDQALQLIVDRGAATWQTMPYSDRDFLTQPSFSAIADASIYKATSYRRINGIQQFKAALANKQPIVIGMDVYDSFYQLSGNNSVYNSTRGRYQGGHAITIIGFDDNRFGGAFKIINSWGSNWGDNGFFWLPYSMVSAVVTQSYILTDDVNDRDSDPVVPVMPIQNDLPNLQIVNWTATYNSQPGGTGEWQWEIINAGSSVANSGYDLNLMLSKDNQIDSSDWFVVYEPISFDLQVGGRLFRDQTNPLPFNFPETLPSGTYFMAVWVDDLQQIDESNEQDNQSFGSDPIDITLPQLPDLAIDYWWTSWDDFSGEGVLEYTVINNGTVPTTRTDWDINLILSEKEDPSTGEYYFLFFESGQFILNSGATVFRDQNNQARFNLFQSQFSEAVPNGTYFMSLWVDDLGLEDESNEINNLSVGNQLITISSARNARTRSLLVDEADNPITTNFNGKRLPKTNVLMRKVKISNGKDGSRSLTFIDDSKLGTQQTAHSNLNNKIFDKVMKSADHVVFPRSERHRMP